MNLKIHSISLLGKRDKNEDEMDIKNNLYGENENYQKCLYTSVFDGHGGDRISKYLKNNILNYIITINNEELKPTKEYTKYIQKVYNEIQTQLINSNIYANSMGSTALIALIYIKNNKKNVKIINLGDCRAVICNKYNIGVQLSKDHKPDKYDELLRIKKLGGKIEYSKNDDPRISGLSVSRCFGDLDCNYISQQPDIFDYKLKTDKFLVLGCDGLWDVLSNQDVIEFINLELLKLNNIKELKNYTNKSLNNIAYKLGEYAILNKSVDNISIIIIFFLDNM